MLQQKIVPDYWLERELVNIWYRIMTKGNNGIINKGL